MLASEIKLSELQPRARWHQAHTGSAHPDTSVQYCFSLRLLNILSQTVILCEFASSVGPAWTFHGEFKMHQVLPYILP